MKRYAALLRGINISGKNQIAMVDLKNAFASLGLADVRTYLNSGNVIFSDEEEDTSVLAERIRAMILNRFSMEIPVFVIGIQELADLLAEAPVWWGTEDKAVYDNLIFMLEGNSAADLAEKIGAPSPELEKIMIIDNAVFWSFDRQKYARANWRKKTAAAGIREMITIRTAGTVRKIVRM